MGTKPAVPFLFWSRPWNVLYCIIIMFDFQANLAGFSLPIHEMCESIGNSRTNAPRNLECFILSPAFSLPQLRGIEKPLTHILPFHAIGMRVFRVFHGPMM